MDFLFWLAIINNIFSIFGFTGVLNHQKELVTGFFAYNAVQMIVAFHYFVDVCADVGIRSAMRQMMLCCQYSWHISVSFHFASSCQQSRLSSILQMLMEGRCNTRLDVE